jgi:hypothetical protein
MTSSSAEVIVVQARHVTAAKAADVISTKTSNATAAKAAHVTSAKTTHVAPAEAAHTTTMSTTTAAAAAAGLCTRGKKAAGKHRACQNHHHSSSHDILHWMGGLSAIGPLSDVVSQPVRSNVAMDWRWQCLSVVSTKFGYRMRSHRT